MIVMSMPSILHVVLVGRELMRFIKGHIKTVNSNSKATSDKIMFENKNKIPFLTGLIVLLHQDKIVQ